MKLAVCSLVVGGALLLAPISVYAQNPPAADMLKTRIEERKQRLQTKIDAATNQRITVRCVAAQAKLGVLGTRVSETNKPVNARYTELASKISDLETRLAEKNIKSSELLGQVSTLKEKLEAYALAQRSFEDSIADAKNVDCKTDPAGFKAALDDARSQAAIVKQSRTDVRQYLLETIRPTLQALKTTPGS